MGGAVGGWCVLSLGEERKRGWRRGALGSRPDSNKSAPPAASHVPRGTIRGLSSTKDLLRFLMNEDERVEENRGGSV